MSAKVAVICFPDTFRYHVDHKWTALQKFLAHKFLCNEFSSIPVSAGFNNGFVTQKESFYRQFFNAK